MGIVLHCASYLRLLTTTSTMEQEKVTEGHYLRMRAHTCNGCASLVSLLNASFFVCPIIWVLLHKGAGTVPLRSEVFATNDVSLAYELNITVNLFCTHLTLPP